MADKEKIEAAIEDRLIRAIDDDLDEAAIKLLENKVTTVRKLADGQ